MALETHESIFCGTFHEINDDVSAVDKTPLLLHEDDSRKFN